VTVPSEDADIEAYLGRVGKAMLWLSSGTRDGIIGELREHLRELAAEKGSVAAALREMEEPERLARGFREVYGFGPGFAAAVASLAAIVSLMTLPSLQGLSVIVLLVLYSYCILVSLYGGWKPGVLCGLSAAVARSAAVAALWLLFPGAYAVPDAAALAFFVLGSALLPVAGAIAGETKRRYIKGRPLEF
jgi:uncharacterized membrane protein